MNILNPMPTDVSRHLHMHGPSPWTDSHTVAPDVPGACGLRVRREPVRQTTRRSPACAHLRLPCESWLSTHHATYLWPVGRFFQRASPVRMHLDRRTVQREHIETDLHYSFLPKLFEHPVENPILGPAVHPHIDSVPSAEAALAVLATCSRVRQRTE